MKLESIENTSNYCTKCSDDNRKQLMLSHIYWESVNSQKSEWLLKNAATGTFLLRNSSDPQFTYSLSVKTSLGPTSVRILSRNGQYLLDFANIHLEQLLPKFNTVIELLQYYVHLSSHNHPYGKQIWVDTDTGLPHSPVILKKPLRTSLPSLKHLSRVVVNKDRHIFQKIPTALLQYLNEYPHSL